MTHDLQTFEVSLHNLDGPLPVATVRANALNGLFHAELGRRHGALVESLHDPRRAKPMPFSLAPLHADGHYLGFRVGTLEPEIGIRVAEVWGSLAAQGTEIRLGSARMRVEQVRPGRPPATSYQQLWEEAPVAHGVRLKFETPLRLKSYGHSGLLPTPKAVWQSYAQRWEAFSPLPLPPEFLRWVEWQVQAIEVTLETRFGYMEKTVEWKGVMGEVAYQAFSDRDDLPASRLPDYLRAWQALALLSEFSGTGEKASMGMGRTRRVEVFGRHREGEGEKHADAG